MVAASFSLLEGRGLIQVGGEDRVAYLQGLVSNDVSKVAETRALYAAFLTPQGRYLHDFFLAEHGGSFLIDCEAERAADLKRRLSLYKLRSKVALADATADWLVAVVWGDGAAMRFGLADAAGAAAPFAGGVAFVDPRLSRLGTRALLPRQSGTQPLEALGLLSGDAKDYHRLRIAEGVPDGSRDLIVDRAILLENGFDELNGVDWQKGCYMGQELTARTKYRGLVRKRLMPVEVEGPMPEPGTPVTLDGAEAGEMRSGLDGKALAMIRLEAFEKVLAEGKTLAAGAALLRPRKPDWASF
ncbi:MAG: folate-binding protein YgfZ [Proteobacteria bacterium]|nr:folate-binding protein YgfZ [Pseudomonadota bacterium]MBI3497878.1 folate-binding protein YgfZ [Pseudomonadota bacterium]